MSDYVKPTLSAAMNTAMDALNGGSSRKQEEEAVASFVRTHRTLQQCFMRTVIVPILVHLADAYATGNHDGRNKDSCRLASKMLAALSEDDLYLPYV
jgi:hypothetical protein